MSEVYQTIHGLIPSKSNGYVITANRLIKSAAVRKYEEKFYIQCHHYRNKNIEGYFELHAKVFFSSERSDLDGCFKLLLDCLQKAKAIKNDNRCTKIIAEKFLDKANPRIEFMLKEI